MTPGEAAAAVAKVIRGGYYPPSDRTSGAALSASVLAVLREDYADTVVLAGPPVVVHHWRQWRVTVTVSAGGADEAAALRERLAERAALPDVDAQVLVHTRGAGVGMPGVVGGKPLHLVPLVGGAR